MERFKLELPPEDKIVANSNFIVNTIIPISIRRLSINIYGILFYTKQDSTEDERFFQLIISASGEFETEYVESHPLYIENISKNRDMFIHYKNIVEKMDNTNCYNTDFDMVVSQDHKMYYSFTGSRVSNNGNAVIISGLMTRDNFIKINLFMNKFMNYDLCAENVFVDKKLHNIQFLNINHLKLDATTTDFGSKVVCSHYTCGFGPAICKFNFVSPKLTDMKLRNMMLPDVYNRFYGSDFIVKDIIYDFNSDSVFVMYEERSSVTNNYKSTKALIFDKDFYNRTNFIDETKIYEKEN